MTANHAELCERLRDQAAFDQKQWGGRGGDYVSISTEAADMLEQQAARIQQQALEYVSLFDQCSAHLARIAELEADRDCWRDQCSQRVADWDAMRKEREAAEAAAIERCAKTARGYSLQAEACIRALLPKEE